jgi:hypothetical protein
MARWSIDPKLLEADGPEQKEEKDSGSGATVTAAEYDVKYIETGFSAHLQGARCRVRNKRQMRRRERREGRRSHAMQADKFTCAICHGTSTRSVMTRK